MLGHVVVARLRVVAHSVVAIVMLMLSAVDKHINVSLVIAHVCKAIAVRLLINRKAERLSCYRSNDLSAQITQVSSPRSSRLRGGGSAIYSTKSAL